MSSRDRLKAFFRSEGAFWIGFGAFFLLYVFVFNPLVRGRSGSPLLAVVPSYFVAAGVAMLFRPEWRNPLVAGGGALLAVLSVYAMIFLIFTWQLVASMVIGLWFTLALFADLDAADKPEEKPEDDEEPEADSAAVPRQRRRKKKRTIAEVFTLAKGTKLADVVYKRVLRYHGDPPDFDRMSEPERDLLLTYHAFGIIGNGGFNYLFEGNFANDPDFTRTLAAYERIGAPEAAAAFRDALALFPGSRVPEDIDERLGTYRSGAPDRRRAIDCRFWDARPEIERGLEAYLRANADAFAHLDGRPRRRPDPDREERPRAEAPPEVASVRRLPHWARVAFAARCGRRVLPRLRENWPGVLPEREWAVVAALELAEKSAREGKPAPGLRDAVMNATVVAGAALMGLYGAPEGMADGESFPPDGNAASRATAVAKAAESAARAAGDADESVHETLAALGFARNAAEGDADLRNAVASDLADLENASLLRKWDDDTPVADDVWKPAG